MSKENPRALRVFLCYATADVDSVRDVCQKLQNDGIEAWMDEQKLLPGQNRKLEILQALENADAIILCVSKQSTTEEGFVQKEMRIADDLAQEKPDGTIFLIPARLEECDLPRRFAGIQHADLFQPGGYQKLFQALSERAARIGLQLAGQKSNQTPPPDMDYELAQMIKGMMRSDEDFQESCLYLKKKEPDSSGWFHESLRREFLQMMGSPACPMKERVRAGDLLAHLGDPRFRSNGWNLQDDDLLGFIEIPGGAFLMGNDMPKSKQEAQCEGPQHQVELPTFHIGRHPVTVAQYQAFLLETNFTWSSQHNESPVGNHPATCVTWYDAVRYCKWLTDTLSSWPNLPRKMARLLQASEGGFSWVVTLPSEAEWEKAARGGADTRTYPWGSKENPDLTNNIFNGLRQTSAVGCFEGGKSPYGVEEMSGNVWEWTRSNWGFNMEKPKFHYPYVSGDGREDMKSPSDMFRVMRGGSCLNRQDEARCFSRGAELPDNCGEHIGFRLAIARIKKQDGR